MKRLTISLILAILMSTAYNAFAIKAVPHPVTVIQPDGTTLTIQLHGDEFLHWTTVGNRLVEKGPDGFYYYAEFNNDGTKTLSKTRAVASLISRSEASTVRPPQAAIAAANIKRQTARRAASITRSNDLGFGDKHFLVLLIEFADLEFTLPDAQNQFFRMLNEEGYSENGGTGSSADYYKENSMNQFSPTFDVYGPIKVSRGYSYYGSNTLDPNERADYLLVEACQIADSQGLVDFSDYDLDNDGVVDNIFFFFAGHNEAEGGGADCIWPHQWTIHRPVYDPFDGKTLNSYACASEYNGAFGQDMAGIGTFTHEFGHVIGLPDFYDTDDIAGGYGTGIGTLSLMDQGSYNNDGRTPPYLSGFERSLLGWLELEEMTEPGTYRIDPVQTNVAYMTPTDNNEEYYVYEYRNGEGNDAYIYATGLAIYHVDRSDNLVSGYRAYTLWEYNMVNNVADHQCYDLIESTYPESAARSNADRLFPGTRKMTEFTSSTSPAAKAWNGNPTNYNLYDIADNGDHASVRLSFVTSADPINEFVDLGINAIYLPKSNFSAGETLDLMLSLSNKTPESVSWYFDGAIERKGRVTLKTGEHTIKAELTYEDGSKEVISTKIRVQ